MGEDRCPFEYWYKENLEASRNSCGLADAAQHRSFGNYVPQKCGSGSVVPSTQ